MRRLSSLVVLVTLLVLGSALWAAAETAVRTDLEGSPLSVGDRVSVDTPAGWIDGVVVSVDETSLVVRQRRLKIQVPLDATVIRRDDGGRRAAPRLIRGERVRLKLRASQEPLVGILSDFDPQRLLVVPQGRREPLYLDRAEVESFDVWRRKGDLLGVAFGAVLLAPVGVVAGGLGCFGRDTHECKGEFIGSVAAAGAVGGLIGYGAFRSSGWVRVKTRPHAPVAVSLAPSPRGLGAQVSIRF